MGMACFLRSEAQMQTELSRTGEVLTCRQTELTTRQVADGLCQIHSIEDVEYIRTKFECETLQGDRLRELCIDVCQAWSYIRVPAQVTLKTKRGRRECRSGSKSMNEVASTYSLDDPRRGPAGHV